MIKSLVLAVATAAGALGATTAHAGGVSWSIGINTPVIGTVISNAPRYYRPAYEPVYDRVYEPVYESAYEPAYAPVPVYRNAPIYEAPVPVYRSAPRVAYYPPAVVVRPLPIVYPRIVEPGWRHHDRHDHRGRWDHRRDDRRDHHRDDRHGDRWDGRGGR